MNYGRKEDTKTTMECPLYSFRKKIHIIGENTDIGGGGEGMVGGGGKGRAKEGERKKEGRELGGKSEGGKVVDLWCCLHLLQLHLLHGLLDRRSPVAAALGDTANHLQIIR